ncbi:hypothetical protein A2U01_0056599, partial [Trifolium medium]|nr:hypothetical protein [Trifolium medium]
DHYYTICNKRVIPEKAVDFSELPAAWSAVEEIFAHYQWRGFNDSIGQSNISWVHEFYANALGNEPFTSWVRGVRVSYSPDIIEGVFGFRASGQCTVTPRRLQGATTKAVCDEMLPHLALPGVGWFIGSAGLPVRMN